MRDPVAFLLFVSLLAIVFPKGNQGFNKEGSELESSLRKDFDKFDTNKDNYIDKEEFSLVYNFPGMEEVFGQYDHDSDTKISFEDGNSSITRGYLLKSLFWLAIFAEGRCGTKWIEDCWVAKTGEEYCTLVLQGIVL